MEEPTKDHSQESEANCWIKIIIEIASAEPFQFAISIGLFSNFGPGTAGFPDGLGQNILREL